eukprot:scaffold363_cov209-Alexandrium_tamarense.AAC.12
MTAATMICSGLTRRQSEQFIWVTGSDGVESRSEVTLFHLLPLRVFSLAVVTLPSYHQRRRGGEVTSDKRRKKTTTSILKVKSKGYAKSCWRK